MGYVAEAEDPSIALETRDLVIKVIDNTGLLAAPADPAARSLTELLTPLTHYLGYHGIRTLYRKDEKRNLVAPYCSWLNLQTATLEGIAPDPVDERAFAGMARGWPMQMERKQRGVVLRLHPLPSMRVCYSLELQPAEPDGLDFRICFEFGRRPEHGPAHFRATWPCYINGYDDVRLSYPKALPRTAPGVSNPLGWDWVSLGEPPDLVLGETVGYRHVQEVFYAEGSALPLAYGRIGDHVLILAFSDPRVRLFVVNAGGHLAFSPVQNPAWDFEWAIEDYPLNEPVGFSGRLIYTCFENTEQVLDRYRQWAGASGSLGAL